MVHLASTAGTMPGNGSPCCVLGHNLTLFSTARPKCRGGAGRRWRRWCGCGSRPTGCVRRHRRCCPWRRTDGGDCGEADAGAGVLSSVNSARVAFGRPFCVSSAACDQRLGGASWPSMTTSPGAALVPPSLCPGGVALRRDHRAQLELARPETALERALARFGAAIAAKDGIEQGAG